MDSLLTPESPAVCVVCGLIVGGPHACAYEPPMSTLERLTFQLKRIQYMRAKAKRS